MTTDPQIETEQGALLNSWYKTYFAILYKYALPKLWFNESLATDCTHQVFDIARKKLHTLQRHSNIAGWLFKTLKYQIAKQYTKEKMRSDKQQIYFMQNAFPAIYQMPLIDQFISDDEISGMKELILDALTSQERQMYQLYYIEHRMLKEICEVLCISLSAAKTRLFRLRNKIYNQITKIFGGSHVT